MNKSSDISAICGFQLIHHRGMGPFTTWPLDLLEEVVHDDMRPLPSCMHSPLWPEGIKLWKGKKVKDLILNYHSGEITIFGQPRFPWNKVISFQKATFWGPRSCEVDIIWPDHWYGVGTQRWFQKHFFSENPELFGKICWQDSPKLPKTFLGMSRNVLWPCYNFRVMTNEMVLVVYFIHLQYRRIMFVPTSVLEHHLGCITGHNQLRPFSAENGHQLPSLKLR